jgi:monothiol glutaredoxin
MSEHELDAQSAEPTTQSREHGESAAPSRLADRIKDVIENEPVALFMKGTPQFVMCGNSNRALEALRQAGAPVTAVDILPDPAIRQELQALSGWPTIPQVFVGGELIGGADITQELAASGELTGILETKLGADYRDHAAEHVVDVLSGTRA